MRFIVLVSAAALLLPVIASLLPAQPSSSGPAFSPAVVAGDFVYLSGALPTDAAGKIVAGDIRQQTARTLDNLAALLAKSGSTMDRVAAVTVYLKSAADFPAMNEVYGKYWPTDPPTRTTVVANLVMPEALVEIAMVALRGGVGRQVVQPAGWLRSPNPYSYGIKSGNTLFLSGLVSRNGKDNTVVTGDVKAQTRTILQNARDILAAAGMTLDDVVSSHVYITDTALFQDMNAAYREAFTGAPPARATVRCGLTGKDYVIEITMLAVKDARRAVVSPKEQALPRPAGAAPGAAPRPVLSPGISVGERLYLSGMLGTAAETKGDVAAQTRETLARIGRTLEAGGYSWTDVVEAVVYMPDLQGFVAMNGAYRAPFGTALPARATVEAGLVAPDGLVEIMMTAVKGQKQYVK